MDRFLIYEPDNRSGPYGAELLVQMREDGAIRDHFRVHVFANGLIQAHFPIARVIDIPQAKGVYAYFQCTAADVEPPINRLARPFFDFQDGMLEGNISLRDENQKPLSDEVVNNFKAQLNNEGTIHEAVGASFRWAIGATTVRTTELVLQALPLPLKFLQPGHDDDDAATLCIRSLDLPMLMGDDSTFEGRSSW